MRQAKLLRASTKILAQSDLDDLLQVVADSACIITSGQLAAAGHGFVNGQFRVKRSSAANIPPCAEGAVFAVEKGGVHMEVLNRAQSLRLTNEQLLAHPAWWGLPEEHVPLNGLMVTRMIGREGAANGIILVSHKNNGEFTADDEATLRQLAAIASLALQNLEARTEAESRAQEAIEHENDLARSNKELEQFAYIASHDLQEPLRTIRSYVQIIEQRYNSHFDAEGREFLQFVSDGASRLQHLVQDLLTYSRISSRAHPLQHMRSAAAMEEAIKSLNKIIAETHSTITADPLPKIKADAVQLTRVFQNLLENAIKFRNPDIAPKIHVSVTESDQEWIFSVADNGIGIDTRYFDRIFVIFQRLHTQAEYPGSGVGLTICRRIIERHGGRIWVESDHNSGTTFFFTMPKHTSTQTPSKAIG